MQQKIDGLTFLTDEFGNRPNTAQANTFPGLFCALPQWGNHYYLDVLGAGIALPRAFNLPY
jgi:hypothetical protein